MLEAMGVPIEQIESSIRISWGPDTMIDDVVKNLRELLEIAKQIKN